MKRLPMVVLGAIVVAIVVVLVRSHLRGLSRWERDDLMAGCLCLLMFPGVTSCILAWVILVG